MWYDFLSTKTQSLDLHKLSQGAAYPNTELHHMCIVLRLTISCYNFLNDASLIPRPFLINNLGTRLE